MASTSSRFPIIGSAVPLLLLLVSSSPDAFVSAKNNNSNSTRPEAVFRPREELLAFRRIMARMARMEKASNKTIQVFFFLPAPLLFVLHWCMLSELLLLLRISLTTFKSLGWFCLCMQSPDGDVICCVPPHLQPAFDHPKLRGHRPEVRTNASLRSSSCHRLPLQAIC
jgi:hypothetical protein